MASTSRNFWRRVGAIAIVAALATATATASDRTAPGQYNPEHESVELFEGIEQGTIAVKLIAKDATEANVLIENKTDKPLNVQLPAAFAAVPVLAQFGGGMGVGGGGTQVGGGGFGGGGGMMGGGGGAGFFNVAPEQVGQLRCTIVCLEHGKRDPRPAIPYEIKPIDSFTDKPAVHELCAMVGSGRIPQRAAQAAAWHLQDGMSWQELAAKQIRFANGTSRPYFAPQELQAGLQIATAAVRAAEERTKTSPSPGESASAR
jgi:hypothetical protein